MKNIKKLADKLRNAIAIENLAYDTAFEEENPDNFLKLADEWEQCNYITNGVREELAAEIVKVTLGQIDYKTAWAMTFKPELHEIIKKIA